VELDIILFNGLAHDVLFCNVEGHASFQGQELPEAIKSSIGKGGIKVLRGNEFRVKLTQYIPTELTEQIFKEIQSGVLSSLDISEIGIDVKADSASARSIRMSLGAHDQFGYSPFILNQ
jgi:hypothetical protein